MQLKTKLFFASIVIAPTLFYLTGCAQQTNNSMKGEMTFSQITNLTNQERLKNSDIESPIEAIGIISTPISFCLNRFTNNNEPLGINIVTKIKIIGQHLTLGNCSLIAWPIDYIANSTYARFEFKEVNCTDQNGNPYFIKASDYNESALGYVSTQQNTLNYQLENDNQSCAPGITGKSSKMGTKVFVYFYKPTTESSTTPLSIKLKHHHWRDYHV